MGILDSITSDPTINQAILKSRLSDQSGSRIDSQLESLKGLTGRKDVRKAAQGFASLLILQMLQQMRNTVPKEGLFGGENYAMDVYTSMFDEKVANKVAQNGSIGISGMIQRSIEKKYDQQNPSGTLEIIKQPDIRKADGVESPALSTAVRGPGKVSRFNHIIDKVAGDVKIDPDLIKAVIMKESSGDPGAVSGKGAKGLMQLMDGTAREMNVGDSMDPEQNIRGGAKYLKKMLTRFSGELPLALAAYNAGPGAVKVYDGIPPYPETQNYVEKVLEYQELFRKGELI